MPELREILLHLLGGQREMARRLAVIEHKLERGFSHMSAETDRLAASVASLNTVTDSVVAMIAGLAQQIRDNATDPAKLNEIADGIDADANKLAAAVTDNTPAAQP